MKTKKQSGQSLVEYVLLISMVAGLVMLLNKALPTMVAQFEAPLKKDYKRIYKYGDPKACGFDSGDGPDCSGTPSKHPAFRTEGGASSGDNFRIFARGKK